MVLAITVVVLRLLQVAGGGLPISLVHPADQPHRSGQEGFTFKRSRAQSPRYNAIAVRFHFRLYEIDVLQGSCRGSSA